MELLYFNEVKADVSKRFYDRRYISHIQSNNSEICSSSFHRYHIMLHIFFYYLF